MDTEQARRRLPHESVHCEAQNARVEFPVNQSSQLPSTTSRHRASLAQDRRHVTSAQPPLLYCVLPVRTENRDTDSDLSGRLKDEFKNTFEQVLLSPDNILPYVAGVCKSMDDCDL